MHIFWVIGLILAFIEFPDFGTPLRRIAGSIEKIAGVKPGEGAAEITADTVTTDKNAAAVTPEIRRKELDHA